MVVHPTTALRKPIIYTLHAWKIYICDFCIHLSLLLANPINQIFLNMKLWTCFLVVDARLTIPKWHLMRNDIDLIVNIPYSTWLYSLGIFAHMLGALWNKQIYEEGKGWMCMYIKECGRKSHSGRTRERGKTRCDSTCRWRDVRNRQRNSQPKSPRQPARVSFSHDRQHAVHFWECYPPPSQSFCCLLWSEGNKRILFSVKFGWSCILLS